MRLYENEVWSFAAGAAASWLATYLHLTKTQRLCKRVKRWIRMLGSENLLDFREVDDVIKKLSEKDLLDSHGWAEHHAKRLKKQRKEIISSHALAAEIIICEKGLGLTRVHGLRALIQTKTLDELFPVLVSIVDDLQHDERFPVDQQKWKRIYSRLPHTPPPSEPRTPMVPLS